MGWPRSGRRGQRGAAGSMPAKICSAAGARTSCLCRRCSRPSCTASSATCPSSRRTWSGAGDGGGDGEKAAVAHHKAEQAIHLKIQKLRRKHMQSRFKEELGKIRQRKGNLKLAQEVVQHEITRKKGEKESNEKGERIKELEDKLAAKNKKSECLVM